MTPRGAAQTPWRSGIERRVRIRYPMRPPATTGVGAHHSTGGNGKRMDLGSWSSLGWQAWVTSG